MDTEEGFTKVHFLIAAVFAVTVALGSFAGTMAMTSMDDGEMSEVTGQEGILMDIHLGSNFQADVLWSDGDGSTNASTTEGVVGLHGVKPAGGALDLTGLTIDADGAASVGTNSSTGAIVIGIPDVPNGISIEDVDPGNASTGSFPGSSSTSIGKVEVGGINPGSSTVEIAANN